MIQVNGLTKTYGNQILFENIRFNINSRERIGLVGRNGHGKTTLFRLIMGVEEPDTGEILFPRNYRVGHLEQHIRFTQPTLEQEACLGLPEEEKYDVWKAEKMLTGLGFSNNDMHNPPGMFSGGFQVRINLAKVLLSKPDLLLLDEPNNYLDIVAIRWLEKFLRSWESEMMLITHDRNFMNAITTHTMAIHRRQVRKIKGDTDKLYAQISLEEEVYERTRVKEEKQRKKTELFITRFRAKARLASMVQSRVKTLAKQQQKNKLKKIEELEFSFKSAPFPAARMMSVHNLSFSYDGGNHPLIDFLSFDIGKRERICVIGPNGKGKSTLLRLLAGVLTPVGGNIKRHNILLSGHFDQTNTAKLNEQLTVYEEIMSAGTNFQPLAARKIAGSFMFSNDAALKKIAVLSGGERSRVMLAKLLVAPVHLLLLDEPTNHLDMYSCDTLIEAIADFEGSVVMVTHNEFYLQKLATRLIVFDQNKARFFDGSYQDFLDSVGWETEGAPQKKQLKKQETEQFIQTPDEKARPQKQKSLKKLQAELRKERAEKLKPADKQIREHEEEITLLEKKAEDTTRHIIKASYMQDGSRVAKLSKENHALHVRIETLYEKLDKITRMQEKMSRDYENRFIELKKSLE